ncbi:hypothetical protein [Nocardioides campestrisoli]|uniref:hypothetical protein n=1 Tax=Nocardioides campestrisoli TaxID=2736757 RepID=UPI00163DCB06|nr:hypothetical protein [Nocardioides campestrisoli]
MSDPEHDVRRLLAAARGSEPIPPPVADRLDETLAELERSRAARASQPSQPSQLSQRSQAAEPRRPRRFVWPAAAAAAVLVVGGVWGTTLGPLGSGGPDGASSSADTSAAGEQERISPSPAPSPAPNQAPSADDAPGAASDGTRRGDAPPAPGQDTLGLPVPEVNPASLVRDLVRARSAAPSPGVLGRLAVAGCLPSPTRPRDRLVEIRYDGRPAALVLRPATSAGQEALVVVCGDEAPIRRATLPAEAPDQGTTPP